MAESPRWLVIDLVNGKWEILSKFCGIFGKLELYIRASTANLARSNNLPQKYFDRLFLIRAYWNPRTKPCLPSLPWRPCIWSGPQSVKRTNISLPNLTLLPNSRSFLPFLICRTSPWTCTFVSFGLIPAYHSSDVRGSKSWWWVLNTLIWFGYPIHSLSMKKRPTSTKPRRKTNSSESCIQGKFCEVLGTFSQTTHTAQNSWLKMHWKSGFRKVFSWLLISFLDKGSINPVGRLR